MLIKPMLLSTRAKAFSSPDYLFEWKVDGVRCIAYIDQGRVQLLLKIKNWREADCYIKGYKLGEPGIYLGLEQRGEIRSAGIATYGMLPEERAAFMAVAGDIEIKRAESSLVRTVNRVKVKHVGVTSNKMLRMLYS